MPRSIGEISLDHGGELWFERQQSRLFKTIWLITHLTDAMAISGLVMRGKLDLSEDKQAMCTTCALTPFEVLIPIIRPMKLTVENFPIDTIILEIKPRGTTPIPGNHNIAAFSEMWHGYVAMSYLRFYEQHLPFIQTKFGSDTKAWPQVFQFAWLIRNGIVHHNGRVNFLNPNYPSVTWKSVTYSPAQNGQSLLGSHFTVGDLLFFLFDLSNDLDSTGAPFPEDQ